MRHLILSVLLAVSIGMATAVSVNKLFADEWNLFKVDFEILIYLVYLLTRLFPCHRISILSHTRNLRKNSARRCTWKTATKLLVIMPDSRKEK